MKDANFYLESMFAVLIFAKILAAVVYRCVKQTVKIISVQPEKRKVDASISKTSIKMLNAWADVCLTILML